MGGEALFSSRIESLDEVVISLGGKRLLTNRDLKPVMVG